MLEIVFQDQKMLLEREIKTENISISIFFIVILIVALSSPLMFDDYRIMIEHDIINSSQNIIADLLGKFVLIDLNSNISSLINAAFITLLAYLIYLFPRLFAKCENKYKFFVICACLFVILNPDINKTMFYRLGSVYYSVYATCALLYVFLFKRFLTDKTLINFILLLVLTALAHSINPAASLMMLIVTISTSFTIIYNKQIPLLQILLINVVAVASFIGNLDSNYFQAEINKNFDSLIASSWYEITVLMLFNLITFLCAKYTLSNSSFEQQQNYKKLFKLGFLFILLAAANMAVLLFKTTLLHADMFIVIIFLLLSLMCFLYVINTNFQSLVNILFVASIICFVVKYAEIYNSYNLNKIHETIRNDHIRYEIFNNKKHIDIPAFSSGFITTTDLKNSQDLSSQAQYFSIDSLKQYQTDIDYSAIYAPELKVNLPKNELNVEKVFSSSTFNLFNKTLLFQHKPIKGQNLEFLLIIETTDEQIFFKILKLQQLFLIGRTYSAISFNDVSHKKIKKISVEAINLRN